MYLNPAREYDTHRGERERAHPDEDLDLSSSSDALYSLRAFENLPIAPGSSAASWTSDIRIGLDVYKATEPLVVCPNLHEMEHQTISSYL